MLEAELRKRSPATDLTWLRAAAYQPRSNAELEIKLFNRRIELIREHRLTTEAAFQAKQLQLLEGR